MSWFSSQCEVYGLDALENLWQCFITMCCYPLMIFVLFSVSSLQLKYCGFVVILNLYRFKADYQVVVNFHVSHVYTRDTTIQCVDVLIYCLWCITIQRYIARYRVESKQWSMLFFNVFFCFLREASELIFL